MNLDAMLLQYKQNFSAIAVCARCECCVWSVMCVFCVCVCVCVVCVCGVLYNSE